jgi:hypothetical protein
VPCGRGGARALRCRGSPLADARGARREAVISALLVLLGILALLAAALAALFTIGTVVAVVVVVAIIAVTAYALGAGGGVARGASVALAVVFIVATAFLGYTAWQITGALASTSGETDPPDAAVLASAERKLDAAQGLAGFRIELTEEELGAVLQDALSDADENPIRRVDLEIVDGSADQPGSIDFLLAFKNGGLTGNGSVGATLDAGRIELEVRDVTLGNLALPGIARGAMGDVIETVFNLNDRLAEVGADVQALEIGQGRVLIVGAQAGGELLSAPALLAAIGENASALGGAVSPPPEQIGPGTVNALEADGAEYVVALGDSLAANVGVAAARDGYVSRVHRVLSERDGFAYGLRNFGVAGE